MIEEAYVSFEVAMLLKEKGFNQETTKRYNPSGELYSYYQNVTVIPKGEAYVCAPTQQMACEWLRQVGAYHVEVLAAYHFRVFDGYSFEVFSLFSEEHVEYSSYKGVYKTAREACDAGIKFCLERLPQKGYCD
jgi:hypothetical protein